ncbi:nitrate/nitrite two-component system sensor histidine kinase NarX [Zobellella endophytica]|uniref:Sensor protein n=1 Tax=Zobellella endophytica TaxID=2116700 RepID=A0A2P7RCW8_9GAMM|nr:histidine kinase [Zobellella endophytica]PSJ48077.1 nitrate/nitrite two-component system sensor histidine kinase NarX [Zobellella endophytica]
MSSIPLSRSLLTRITLLMLTLVLLALIGLAASAWLSEKTEGRAFVINKAGSLRMQSYRLLSRVPLQDGGDLQMLEQDLRDPVLMRILQDDGLGGQHQQLWQQWQPLKAGLQAATSSRQLGDEVAGFVAAIDRLVAQLEQNTEASLQRQSWLQFMVMLAMLLILGVAVVYLHRRLITPLRRLLLVARAVGNGDFACRSGIGGDDEMAVLAGTIDTMNRQLSELYGHLEQKVEQQTRALVRSNQTLTTLYDTQRELQGVEPLYRRLPALLGRLEQLTPLRQICIHLYEEGDDSPFEELTACSDRPGPREAPNYRCPLQDNRGHYGQVLAYCPPASPLDDEQQQLLTSIFDQITTALALERRQHQHQQLQLMEERATIARELHDSLAQALTYLKLQVSYVRLQLPDPSPEVATGLDEMREGLNNAYRQLRELLTTFRLKLDKPGLYAALSDTVAEFSRRLGFAIEFEYQLSPHRLGPNQTIHLVQITREALHNVIKHAHASEVGVRVWQQGEYIYLSVADNGTGVGAIDHTEQHYGVNIMQDRASSLGGQLRVVPGARGGTLLEVCFRP